MYSNSVQFSLRLSIRRFSSSNVWKDIHGFQQYQVSTNGQIWSKKTLRILKQPKRPYTAPRISLKDDNGFLKTVSINRVVLQTFKPNVMANTLYAAHKDNNPQNNCLSNLEWRTPKQSSQNRSNYNHDLIYLTP